MTNSLKIKMLNYLSKRNIDNKSGFTLVELIVVVVIIGILSSIAIPGFNNASDKAKQKEASTLLASYVKAAQAYYTENSELADTVGDLNQFIIVSGCANNDAQACKGATTAVANNSVGWNSPTGNYVIAMTNPSNNGTAFTATPKTGWTGYPVAAVFCTSTGSTILNEGNQKGAAAAIPNCP